MLAIPCLLNCCCQRVLGFQLGIGVLPMYIHLSAAWKCLGSAGLQMSGFDGEAVTAWKCSGCADLWADSATSAGLPDVGSNPPASTIIGRAQLTVFQCELRSLFRRQPPELTPYVHSLGPFYHRGHPSLWPRRAGSDGRARRRSWSDPGWHGAPTLALPSP
jgi:hypothetical protein